MRKKLDHIRIILYFSGLILALLLQTHPLTAEEKAEEKKKEDKIKFEYRAVETENLILFYGFEEQDFILKHLSRCHENSMNSHMKFFDYTPSEKVTIYLNDSDDFGYAGTTTIPNNWITLGIEPFEYVYDTCPTNERMNWVMNHELVHVVASDQATGSDKFFRKLFLGKVSPTDEDPLSMYYSYLTNPRRYAPRWYHEGIAVFMETWMAGGIGRSLTGYDEMTFRAMVRDDLYFYDTVGLESEGTAVDFQIGQNSYLYGTRFISYLAYQHGPEKVIEWIKRNEGSERYFSKQFKKVFGAPLDEEWKKWIDFEHEWQEANLKTIRQYPVTSYREISARPLGSVSREFYNPEARELYVAVTYPAEFSHIAGINVDTGEIRKLCEIPTPALYYVTSLAYDPFTSTLYFTTDNSRSWRDLNALDIETGKIRKVLKNCRVGDLVFNKADKSLWGMQHHNGYSRLVRIPPPYEGWETLLVLSYGKDLFDIDISPDGKYLTGSLTEVSGRQRLIRMETEKLRAFDDSYELLWEFEDNTPENFVFSPDGRHLFGTSYYTGVSNVFRYDFDEKKMEAISNCEVGYFRPLLISDNSLIVFRYTGEGFVPAIIYNEPIEDVNAIQYLGQAVVNEHPQVKDWVLGSPMDIDIDSVTISSGDYHPFRRLKVVSAYPIVQGYKDEYAAGMRVDLMDPVGVNALDFSFSYSPTSDLPSDERSHLHLRYRRFPWTFSGTWNRADFYDIFGPTKVSRKGYSLVAKYENFFILDRPKSLDYSIRFAKYWNMDTTPLFQNVATSYDDFYTFSAGLYYANLRKTIGAIQPEKGMKWNIGAYGSYILSEFYPLMYTNLDYGFLLPIDHSSLWFRTSLGYSFGEREEPMANFYFGGFGNNYVDHASVNRYREFYSFPGVELNAIPGNNYAKAMVEWTLPPIRFKRAGFPALYANWMSFALFSTGIVTNLDDGPFRREVGNVGIQMNLKLVIFSSMESTLSLGYAVAGEEGRGPEREFMASLKILR